MKNIIKIYIEYAKEDPVGARLVASIVVVSIIGVSVGLVGY